MVDIADPSPSPALEVSDQGSSDLPPASPSAPQPEAVAADGQPQPPSTHDTTPMELERVVAHARMLEQELGRLRTSQPPQNQAPAAPPPNPYTDVVAKFTERHGEEAGEIFQALTDRLASLEAASSAAKATQQAGSQGPSAIPSVDEIRQQVAFEAAAHGWLDAKAKSGFGNQYGTDRAMRQQSPAVQAEIARVFQPALALQNAAQATGLNWDLNTCLDLVHGQLHQQAQTRGQAAQQIRSQMQARSGQRMPTPSGMPGKGVSGQDTSREAGVSAIEDILSRR